MIAERHGYEMKRWLSALRCRDAAITVKRQQRVTLNTAAAAAADISCWLRQATDAATPLIWPDAAAIAAADALILA